jgi:hypothetical protein
VAVDYTRPLERRYLLGETTEDERLALEDTYFRDPAALERVEAAEDDLIEAYLAGELGADERGLFEGQYLQSPAHQERVEIIRGLHAFAAKPVAPKPTVVAMPVAGRLPKQQRRSFAGVAWWGLAAAAAIVLVGGTWMMSRSSAVPPTPATQSAQATTASQPPSSQTAPSQTAQAAPAAPAAAPQPQTPTTARSAPRLFAFSLSSVSVRAESAPKNLVIPPNVDVVELTLDDALAGETRPPASAHVVIRTPSGAETFRAIAAIDARRAPAIRVGVPADRLQPDDYIITVTAAGQEIAHYVLHVRAR